MVKVNPCRNQSFSLMLVRCVMYIRNLVGIYEVLWMQGIVSNTEYGGKRTSMMLFINGRPVDCSPLKRAIEITYTTLLPKAAKPWVFLASFGPHPLLVYQAPWMRSMSPPFVAIPPVA
jgi:hypothetical protein